jgi:hypothetical protein
MNWQNKKKWEFYVDFETYNSHYDESTELNDSNESNSLEELSLQKMYMIGVGNYNNHTNKYDFKCFIIKS